MTRGAKLVLPSGSMPWGRYMNDSAQATEAAIRRERSNEHSAGSQFKSRAENMSAQIAGVQNVATVYRRDLPNFSRSPQGGGPYSVASPLATFNPPRPGEEYTFSAIAEFRATVGGNSNFNFPKYYLSAGNSGTAIWSSDGYFGPINEVRFSMMYTATNKIASSITCQFIISSQGLFDGSPVNFTQSSITGVFLGAL